MRRHDDSTGHEGLNGLPNQSPVAWDGQSGSAVVDLPARGPCFLLRPASRRGRILFRKAHPLSKRLRSRDAGRQPQPWGGRSRRSSLVLWLLSMLATLTSSLPAPPAAPAIDSAISTDEEAVPEPEEISKFELTDPKNKEYDAGRAPRSGEHRPVCTASRVRCGSSDSRFLGCDASRPGESRRQRDPFAGAGGRRPRDGQGTTGDAHGGRQTALDRVTWEIANHLLEHKTLVVWLLDASGTSKNRRGDHYQPPAPHLQRAGGSGTGGQGRHPHRSGPAQRRRHVRREDHVRDPRADRRNPIQTQDAVKNGPMDPSGVENVFGAVELVMHRWQKSRPASGAHSGNHRHRRNGGRLRAA